MTRNGTLGRFAQARVADKPDKEQRAGTTLGRVKTPVYTARNRRQPVGWIDQQKALFQTGGESGNFIYRKEHLLTLPADVWEQVRDVVTVIEMVDHQKNVCYQTSTADALRHGHRYNAGLGPRFGWPVTYSRLIDEDDTALPSPVPAGEPPEEPPATATLPLF